jgi:hypothetical protein
LWDRVSILPFSTILIFDFGIISAVFYFLLLILLEVSVIIFCPKSNDLQPVDSTSVSSALITLAAIVLFMFMLSFFPVREC